MGSFISIFTRLSILMYAFISLGLTSFLTIRISRSVLFGLDREPHWSWYGRNDLHLEIERASLADNESFLMTRHSDEYRQLVEKPESEIDEIRKEHLAKMEKKLTRKIEKKKKITRYGNIKEMIDSSLWLTAALIMLWVHVYIYRRQNARPTAINKPHIQA
jgi:hypothetical protein